MKRKLDQQVARQNHKSHNMSLNRGVASAMVSLCFVFSVEWRQGRYRIDVRNMYLIEFAFSL